jgi:hypothetical protein
MADNQQTTIKIGGKEYPLRYPMGALTRVLRTLNVSAEELSDKANSQNLIDLFNFSLTVAWTGIVSGEKFAGVAQTFAEPAELAEVVEELDELQPAITAFTDAWQRFVGSDEPAVTASEVLQSGELLPPSV